MEARSYRCGPSPFRRPVLSTQASTRRRFAPYQWGMLTPAARTTANAARIAVAGLALLALSACSRPDWTNPEMSKAPRALPPNPKKALPGDDGPAPPVPAWAAPLMGKPLRAVFPADGVCMGNTDRVIRVHRGQPPGAVIVGWAWEYAAKAPVPRVVLVDASDIIVGVGETGQSRPDVPNVVPAVTSPTTGWEGIAYALTGHVRAFGVIDNGRAVCALGAVEL